MNVMIFTCSFLSLCLITLSALSSEYAGRMACFLDGIINAGAFFCFAFTVFTGNIFAGILLSVITCTVMVFMLERTAVFLNSNIFLAGLAMNILFTALSSFFSAAFFKTRSTLTSADFFITPFNARLITIIVSFILISLLAFFIYRTKPGLALRISGSSQEVLESKGISADFYKSLSWIFCGICGSFCGCTLALKISSYVPGIASGKGWIALAAVFLGKKNPLKTLLCVFVFSLCEMLSSYIPNLPALKSFSSAFLLAFPYLISLVLIVFSKPDE